MPVSLSAQTPAAEYPPCLFDVLHPAGTLQAAESRIGAAIGQTKTDATADNGNDIRTIPVVVHVIHNGGTENISQAQIERQIQILNEDWGRLPGSPGEGAGIDTGSGFVWRKLTRRAVAPTASCGLKPY